MDHYEALGIPPTARPDQIRRAYKAKALETHPDKASTEDKLAAEARFHQVQQAFEVLSDPFKRRTYDIQQGYPKLKTASDTQSRRNREREAWALKSWQESEEHFRLLRQQARDDRTRQEVEYKAMVERILAEFHRQNPEWKSRQQHINSRVRQL
ncbi:J domain-containing protein [Mycena indigotica]|uniref:J domain-containing protein n=1 Tax=Mycena indigotica TaxID=2126181 RepID=A0A8H6T2C5_9AGAR|nr:J domain-containing protein [Mycena indigotica]KAF7309585.1 J domain-containing protein [Mycena indigotica]